MSATGIKVSKEEFDKFVKTYPRELCCDVWGACEPPLVTYNDFTLGNWPDSVVARTWAYSDKVGDYYYAKPEDRDYYVLEKVPSVCISNVVKRGQDLAKSDRFAFVFRDENKGDEE